MTNKINDLIDFREDFARAAETGELNENVLACIGTWIEMNEQTIDDIWRKVRSNDKKFTGYPTKYELTDSGIKLTISDPWSGEDTDILPFRYLFDNDAVEEALQRREKELQEAKRFLEQQELIRARQKEKDERNLLATLKAKYEQS